jgi:hypothetical protein
MGLTSTSNLFALLAVFLGVAVIRWSLRDALVFVGLVGGATALAYMYFGPSGSIRELQSKESQKAKNSANKSSIGKALMLHISGGPLDDKRHTITTSGAKCGRHTSNAIILPEAAVSRHHFSVEYKAKDQSYYLVDEGSTTGREHHLWSYFATNIDRKQHLTCII